MNPRSERMHTVNVTLTENEALDADQKTDAQARAGVCVNGPQDCTGRFLPTDGSEPNFRRHGREFRVVGVFAGGASIAVRKYVCRFCGQTAVFSCEVPKAQPLQKPETA